MSKKMKILIGVAVGIILIGIAVRLLVKKAIENEIVPYQSVLMSPPARLPVMTPPTAPPPGR